MIPKTVIKRIMLKETKKHGMKISKESLEKMCEQIKDVGVEISSQAKTLAKHAGRETVNESDVKLVIK